jgi:hypothetical protein
MFLVISAFSVISSLNHGGMETYISQLLAKGVNFPITAVPITTMALICHVGWLLTGAVACAKLASL